ncbi:MAG: uracil phosphoribosyltransferase [Actinomycetota bacterium]|nr:uracil phosphoribosyltransferase [Actinomycetota bacterium]
MAMSAQVHVLAQTNQIRAMHTIIRDRQATRSDFVRYSRRIIRLLLESGLDLLPFAEQDVTTPVGATYRGLAFSAKICGVSVVRAGESMEAELRELHPSIRIGKILIQRDKQTTLPRAFYSQLPDDIGDRHVLLMEPMLATAGSAILAIELLAEAGVRPDRIVLVNFLASPAGLERICLTHPELKIVTASVETGMNEHAFMIPGIGDFGDRYFGTTDSGTPR